MMYLFGFSSESESWWATTWKPPEMRIRHIHSLSAQGLGKQKDVLGDAPSLYTMSQNHMVPSQTRKGGSSPSSAHIKDPPASLWHSLEPYAYYLVSNSTRLCFTGFLGLRDRRNLIFSSIKIWYQSQWGRLLSRSRFYSSNHTVVSSWKYLLPSYDQSSACSEVELWHPKWAPNNDTHQLDLMPYWLPRKLLYFSCLSFSCLLSISANAVYFPTFQTKVLTKFQKLLYTIYSITPPNA